MGSLSTIGLWCLTTVASILAAESSGQPTPPVAPPSSTPAVTILAGPWMLLGEDGTVRLGAELSGPVDASTIRLDDGKRLATPEVAQRSFRVANRAEATVIELTLPRTPSGLWSVHLPTRQVTVRMPQAPTRDEVARVAFASATNWPRTQDLVALAESAGGPIQVVVAIGLQSALMLGTGGWESDIPVVIIPQELPTWTRQHDQQDALCRARLGSLTTHWISGTRWGSLGLPWAVDPAAAARVIARDLSPWEVCLAPGSWWELGLLAPRINRTAEGTEPLIALCRHLQVPLILTMGSGAGWISEPLVVDGEQVRSARHGTRVIAATPAGDGVGLLPAHVASVIDDPGVIALVAEPTRLRVLGQGFSGSQLVNLTLRRSGDGLVGDGVGVPEGDFDVVDLHAKLRLNDDAGAAARARCQWVTKRDLATLHLESPDLLALLQITEAPGTVPLLRRLTALEELGATAFTEHRDSLPPVVLRDLLLRTLARPGSLDAALWTPVIARSDDVLLMSALIRAHQDHAQPVLLDLLVARVRVLAAGSGPLTGDAMLLHRLMTTVFDSTSLSPTILRPLAVALRPRLSDFTKGPVERFIARHGEVRK